MTGNLLPFWGWLLILAVILVISSFEYGIRQQKSITEIPSKEPKRLKDEHIKIRRLGDQVSKPIDGRTLIKKWGIESNVLSYMTIKRHINVYNPGMNAIINKPTDHIYFYLDTYAEENEAPDDVILRCIFRPEDIREFEGKVRSGLLPEYILLKTKWKRKPKIKREDMKHK